MTLRSCHVFFLICLCMMLSMHGIEKGYLVIRKSKKYSSYRWCRREWRPRVRILEKCAGGM